MFRRGKVPATAAGYAREARLLMALGPHLPVAIPQPRWVAGPSARFPGGVSGYRLLPGRPLAPADLTPAHGPALAADLAAFLLALHRVMLPGDRARGLPGPPAEILGWEGTYVTVLPALRARLTPAEYEAVARWWAAFL